MKITRRQLRKIIRESINEIRLHVGGDISFSDFRKMARHFGKTPETARTGRDSYFDYISADLPRGYFVIKHKNNMSLGSNFVTYSFEPRDGSKPIKDESISSEREMYEIVQSYLNPKFGDDPIPLPSGLRGKAPGTGIIET